MFSIFKLQEHMEQNMTKILVLTHPYGMPINMQSIVPLLDKHEKQFGFRPVVIEDRTMSNGSSLEDIPSFVQLYATNKNDFAWIVWPHKEWCHQPKLEPASLGLAFMEMVQWPNQQKSTIRNYKHLQSGIGNSLQKQNVTSISLVREAHTTLTVCSPWVPLLTELDMKTFLQSQNITHESHKWGVAISCGHWFTTDDMDRVIRQIDHYLQDISCQTSRPANTSSAQAI